jgi:hypothetical protein
MFQPMAFAQPRHPSTYMQGRQPPRSMISSNNLVNPNLRAPHMGYPNDLEEVNERVSPSARYPIQRKSSSNLFLNEPGLFSLQPNHPVFYNPSLLLRQQEKSPTAGEEIPALKPVTNLSNLSKDNLEYLSPSAGAQLQQTPSQAFQFSQPQTKDQHMNRKVSQLNLFHE